MTENRTIHLLEIPIGGKDGRFWNRLHEEREDICEALVKTSDSVSARREQLQARLRKIDDALDRLMSGSYGKKIMSNPANHVNPVKPTLRAKRSAI